MVPFRILTRILCELFILFIYLFIYTRKIVSTNMLKKTIIIKKLIPNIIRYKNQLIYMIAVWEPKEEK